MNSAVYYNVANNCKSLFIKFPNRLNCQFKLQGSESNMMGNLRMQ